MYQGIKHRTKNFTRILNEDELKEIVRELEIE